MNEIEASKSVLVEALTVLAKDMDKIVVVGGWVPELVFPMRGHIGSLDVDLALDARSLKPSAYESIRKRLTDAGYTQTDMPNRFVRKVGAENVEVKVDLITGEFPGEAAEGSHLLIQEMQVWKARGVDLAFSFTEEIKVDGALPGGALNTVKARIPMISAFLCIKAITLSERKKPKDAYDICFCILNYPGGPEALAVQFRPLLTNPLAAEGLSILREKFKTVGHIGPVWAAEVVAEQPGADDPEIERRRAYEAVNSLLDAIEAVRRG